MSTQKAILKALINDVITELMVKTSGDQVYLNETTTASAKIAELVAAVNDRAKTADVTAAINELRQELLGDTPVEAYNTFTELAEYIEAHQEASDALTAAIGNKADASAVTAIQKEIDNLGDLANKDTVSESDLDSNLKAKVNAASEGNHSHNNKTVLDGITADKVSSWDSKLPLAGGNMATDARIEITKSQNDEAGYGVSDGTTFAMMTADGVDVGEVSNVDSTTQIRPGYVKADTFIGNLEGTVDLATKAVQLSEAKTIKTNLASTTAVGFDGTSNVTPGVSGILPIANGGTGASTAAGALSKLGVTASATELNYMDGVKSNVQTQIDTKASVYISTTQPTNLKSTDLWFDIS